MAAVFNTRDLQCYITNQSYVTAMEKCFDTMEKDRMFNSGMNWDDYLRMPLTEFRLLAVKRARLMSEYQFIEQENIFENPHCAAAHSNVCNCIEMSFGMLYFLNRSLFSITIYTGSKNAYALALAEKADKMEIIGSFSLTELAHGSNTKGMRTTAKYDSKTQEFVVNSPSFEDMKCWAGNLGEIATHTIVYAQLFTPDGMNHGLHPFIVQIRDVETHLAVAGVTVGDMGIKHGLNGLSNGYILFDNVRVPRESLINKQGDVTPSGKYVSPFKNANKRFGAVLGSLSGGRCGITVFAASNLAMAVTIAIRYSSQRKQFGPTDDVELPVMEYQMQQWRLFPYLASSIIWQSFAVWFSGEFYKTSIERLTNVKVDPDFEAAKGKEMHALSCASKAVASWTAQRGIQEAREACGGHGYLAVNRLGVLRDYNDPNCTYEGDNNCILMQTSNYLLSIYRDLLKGQHITSPYGSVDFLNNFRRIGAQKCAIKSVDDITSQAVIDAIEWLVVYLLRISEEKYQEQLRLYKDEFSAKNDSQVYFAISLAKIFIESVVLHRFAETKAFRPDCPKSFKKPLHDVFMLHGLCVIERNLTDLFAGGYLSNPEQAGVLRKAILHYCMQIKPIALSLVESIAPPDWVLNSPIGHSNLKPLENLHKTMVTKASQKRPDWWKLLKEPIDVGCKSHLIISKL